MSNDNKNDFLKRLRKRAFLVGTIPVIATGEVGCNTAKSQNDTSIQVEVNQEDSENIEKISLEQLYEQLKIDGDYFKQDTYNEMTLEEKIIAERKTIEDASSIIRIKLANAITKGTHKQCNPKDVYIVYFLSDNEKGISWKGAEDNYTIEGKSRNKKIGSQEIAYIIDKLTRAEAGRHFNNGNSVTITDKIGLNDGEKEDKVRTRNDGKTENKIQTRFELVCQSVLETQGYEFTFNRDEFGVIPEKDHSALEYEFFIDKSYVYDEPDLTIEQLYDQIELDSKMFELPWMYQEKTLEEQTAVERKARMDASLVIRTIISEAIENGTGEKCNPDDVYLVCYNRVEDVGFTWNGADHTYTTKGFKGTDNIMPDDLIQAINSLTRATAISHFDNTDDGVIITARVGLNEDRNDNEAISSIYYSMCSDVLASKDYDLKYDGENFIVEQKNKDDNTINHDDIMDRD